MKKFILAILMTTATLSIRAELSSMFELSVGGGWSSLGYKVNNNGQPLLTVKQAGSYGLTAHLGYGLMFNQYIGLGIGADFSRYGATTKISGTAQWKGVTDTDGELYDHLTDINNWKDVQEVYMVEIPLSVYFRAPLQDGRSWFSAVIGAKVGIPVLSNAKYSGELRHTAFYEPWQLTLLDDVRGHGFYSSEMSSSYSISPLTSYAAFAKIGLETALDKKKKVYLYGHIYANYYFTNTLKFQDPQKDLGFINDSQDQALQAAHYFMQDYTSILDTKMTNGKAMPISIGIEIGVRFRIPHPKHYPCHCIKN